MTRTCDVVVVGSGHNGLVAAAYLARAGLSVQMLERSALAGGAVRSEELTEPGFVHDTFSATHTIFKLSMAYAELGDELAAKGLRYCETPDETTVTVLPDGRVTLVYRDIERTAAGSLASTERATLARSRVSQRWRRPWARCWLPSCSRSMLEGWRGEWAAA